MSNEFCVEISSFRQSRMLLRHKLLLVWTALAEAVITKAGYGFYRHLCVYLSLCFFARMARYLKNDAARITQLDIEMFHHESWTFVLGSKGQRSRS